MKFAVNYSKEAEELLSAGEIHFDLFKCPDADFDPELYHRLKARYPAYIHFPLNTIGDGLVQVNWESINEQLKETRTPYVNLHFITYDRYFPSIPMNSVAEEHKEILIDSVLKDIKLVTDRFGSEQVIIENVVYRAEGHVLHSAIEPDVISTIVRESGCGLLLDLAHAQLTSKIMGYDVYEYLKGFPLEGLKELHTTGIQHDGERYRDSMPMTIEDWSLTTWAIEQIKKREVA